MNLVNQPAVLFALRYPSGRICRFADYSGSWLLMVYHRHLG